MSIRLACCSAGAFSIPGKAVASYIIVKLLSALQQQQQVQQQQGQDGFFALFIPYEKEP